MKKIYLLILLIFLSLRLGAQDILIFDTPNSTGGEVKSCEGIVLAPGFSFKATSGKSMTFSIDKSVCSPRQEAIAVSSDKNYIITVTPLDASSNVEISDGQLTIDRDSRTLVDIQYYDGLGRPDQLVQVGITPGSNPKDLITIQQYDAFGREWKIGLPIPKAGNKGAYHTGGITPHSIYGNDSHAYSETVYEPSPLNRVTAQYGPGAAWRSGEGHKVSTGYLANNSGDCSCAYYYVSGNSLVKNGNYANGQLYVTKTTDEDGRIAYEFKNQFGQVVLQRQMDGAIQHNTYSVYDNLGNLRFVVPPMAADLLSANSSWNENSDVLKKYAYLYRYDGRNRCVWKKLPGCDPIEYVYDKADRLIFTQDGEQRAKGDWLFSIPDAFGRTVITGTVRNMNFTPQNGFPSNSILACVRDGYILPVAEYTGNGETGYKIINQAQQNMEIAFEFYYLYTINYYDDYLRLLNLSSFYKSNLNYEEKAGYGKRFGSDKGLLVGTRVMILDSGDEIATALYYDYKGQLIQKKSTNYLGGFEKEYYACSFTGQVEKKEHHHSAPGKANINETYTYTYDHAGRLTETRHKLNNDPEISLSRLTYNDLGKVSLKVANGSCGNGYDYNIRGWLKSIYSSSDFNEVLYYETSHAGSIPQYGGNISATKEFLNDLPLYNRVSDDDNYSSYLNGYTYEYDGLSRLKKSRFLQNMVITDRFSEEMTYDKQGNILTLKRNNQGFAPNYTPQLIDNLTLSYNGNRLQSITEAAPSYLPYGFVKPAGAPEDGQEYSYNKNGAMTKDFNRGIGISYNSLNLPQTIGFTAGHSNVYLYDATGVKRRVYYWTQEIDLNLPPAYTGQMQQYTTRLTSMDYCGNIIYENDMLKYILTDEGYVTRENGSYFYHFYRKDHLGNVRAVMHSRNNQLVVRGGEQITAYYPSGMTNPFLSMRGEMQPYKYNGKELDEMHGLNLYDSQARWYDPVIGRPLTPDPLAELTPHISPYAYVANNPVNAIDPDGRSTWVMNNGDGTYRVVGGDLEDNDYNIYVYSIQEGKLARGESIGVTTSITSFYDSYANDEKGAWATGSIIDPNDNSGKDFLNNDIIGADPEAGYYMDNAKRGQKYDFKSTNGGDMPILGIDEYRGMPLGKNNKGNMIYTSAKDIGNIAAGYVAGVHGVPWSMARKQFDKLQSAQDGRPSVELLSTQNAERVGWNIGHEKAASGLIPRLWRARATIWDYLTK